MRILVVEDNIAVARIVIAACQEAGHLIAGHARTVEQGLRLVSECEFDVAILDVDLMGANSGPVAEELGTRGVPFLVCSGASHLRVPAHNGAPLVLKPFKTDTLLKALESIRKQLPECISARPAFSTV